MQAQHQQLPTYELPNHAADATYTYPCRNTLCPCRYCCRSSHQGSGRGCPAARETIVLDMGLYETALRMLPLAAVDHYATSRPSSCTSSLQHSHSSTYGASRTASQSALAALRAISYGVLQERQLQPARSDVVAGGFACVRLYQLLAPGLARRAVVFGNQLALCDSWRCLDPPFFAAPGKSEWLGSTSSKRAWFCT